MIIHEFWLWLYMSRGCGYNEYNSCTPSELLDLRLGQLALEVLDVIEVVLLEHELPNLHTVLVRAQQLRLLQVHRLSRI
jgi:hypothetical protein